MQALKPGRRRSPRRELHPCHVAADAQVEETCLVLREPLLHSLPTLAPGAEDGRTLPLAEHPAEERAIGQRPWRGGAERRQAGDDIRGAGRRDIGAEAEPVPTAAECVEGFPGLSPGRIAHLRRHGTGVEVPRKERAVDEQDDVARRAQFRGDTGARGEFGSVAAEVDAPGERASLSAGVFALVRRSGGPNGRVRGEYHFGDGAVGDDHPAHVHHVAGDGGEAIGLDAEPSAATTVAAPWVRAQTVPLATRRRRPRTAGSCPPSPPAPTRLRPRHPRPSGPAPR